VQDLEQSCGCQGVLGSVHRQKDPQTSCTLPGCSFASSEADQDRARCRIEQAIARLTIPARITQALAFLLQKYKRRPRTLAQGFVRLSNKDLELSDRNLTVPPLTE